MTDPSRPGPKPRRLYVRTVRVGDTERTELPEPARVRRFESELERVGRLVARGQLTQPPGDLLIFRAASLDEAQRVLRSDPFRGVPGTGYDLVEWNPVTLGSGANLDLAPARGSGRLTALLRVGVAVRDLESSLLWYAEVLGFPVREVDQTMGYAELALGRGASAVSLIAPRRVWGEPFYSETMARIGMSTGIVFQTDSASALEARLRSAGARVTEPPRLQPWGGTTIRFTDPDGNEFLAFQSVASPGKQPVAVARRAEPTRTRKASRRPPREIT